METELITNFHGLSATLIDNYPDLAEEAHMRPGELLDMGYDYDELINRREIPVVSCSVKRDGDVMKVYCHTTRGLEYIGYTKEIFSLPARTSLIIEGGQYIKIVEKNGRNRKEEITLPYRYILSVKPY